MFFSSMSFRLKMLLILMGSKTISSIKNGVPCMYLERTMARKTNLPTYNQPYVEIQQRYMLTFIVCVEEVSHWHKYCCWIKLCQDEDLYYGLKYWLLLLNIFKYIFVFSFVVWRCFFFTFLYVFYLLYS